MKQDEIKKLANVYAKKLRIKLADPRYKKVIGKFMAAGLLEHNKVSPYRGRITLDEVLWVGDLEPRVLELLPAILLRRPKLIEVQNGIPEELRQILIGLRKGVCTLDFRGVSVTQYAGWVNRLGRKPTAPSVLRTFRFQRADVERLDALKKQTGLNESEIVRKALREL